MRGPRPDYRKPKTVTGPRRRYAYRKGKLVDITKEVSEEISRTFHIGNMTGRGWNGR